MDKIIAYETLQKAKRDAIKGNGKIGQKCWHWYSKLKEKGGLGGGIVKEYSFVYDVCVLKGLVNYIGDGFSGVVGKEKYDAVKSWIKTYGKQAERWNNARRKELEGDKDQ